MSRFAAAAIAIVIGSAQMCPAPIAFAQPTGPIGPPISPEQVFRQQPAPTTTLPSPSISGSTNSERSTATAASPGTSRGRVAECQHQAAVDRVPQRERASYVHNCASARD